MANRSAGRLSPNAVTGAFIQHRVQSSIFINGRVVKVVSANYGNWRTREEAIAEVIREWFGRLGARNDETDASGATSKLQSSSEDQGKASVEADGAAKQRFYWAVALDVVKAKMDFVTITEEVVQSFIAHGVWM